MKLTLNYALMDGIWCCRSKQCKTGGQHADWSQWNQVGSSERQQQERPRLELGSRGRWCLRGQMKMRRRRMEDRMEVVLQKLSGEPGTESLPVVPVMMGCREM